jgi:hypothetical protein
MGVVSLIVWAQPAQVGIAPKEKAAAEKEIARAKKALTTASGKLRIATEKCCLKPEVGGCAMCMITLGGDCTCRARLLAGTSVCPECGFRWLEGKGLAPDKVKLSQVKTLIDDLRKEQGVTLEE